MEKKWTIKNKHHSVFEKFLAMLLPASWFSGNCLELLLSYGHLFEMSRELTVLELPSSYAEVFWHLGGALLTEPSWILSRFFLPMIEVE